MTTTSPLVAGASTAPGRGARLPHIRALDGYRGIGVAAVVLFHFDLLPGGWLGVDLFFVLSGFLITRLLVYERALTGTIDMRAFWRRRGRRLLPAVILLLAGVALYALWYPDRVTLPVDLPAQMFATLFYFANWQNIFSGGSYWDQFAASSPLRHMWSLAIEEQFYVLFPVVMAGLFGLFRRKLNIAWVLGIGAVFSWSLGVLLLATGHSFERVYLGTDTRIGAVLLGALAGYLCCDPVKRRVLLRWSRRLRPVAVLAVLAAIALLDGSVDWSPQRWLFMPAFELSVVVLLVGALDDPTRERRPFIERVVESSFLGWLGTISYGLYLWHIPIMLAIQRGFAGSAKPLIFVVSVGLSLAISQASFTWVEKPIRIHGLGIAPRFTLVGAAVILVVGSMSAASGATEKARDHRDSRASAPTRTQVVEVPAEPGTSVPVDGSQSTPSSSEPTPDTPDSTDATEEVDGEPPAVQVGAQLPLSRPAERDPRILLVGDSVAYDLSDAFLAGSVDLGYTASASSRVGCGLGGIRFDPTGNPGLTGASAVKTCDEWIAARNQLVEKTQPDVVLVTRVESRQPEPGESTCGPANLEWFGNALRSDIATLGRTGATVAVASHLYRRYGAATSKEHDDATDCLNEVIRSVTEELPNAVYLPLNEWVCPTRDNCIVTLDGVVLRPDGLHFQEEGAVVATRWIIGQLFGA